MSQGAESQHAGVLIVGGGVAGLEALMALHDMAGNRAALTLVSPEPDFVYKPLMVEEPFGMGPAEQHALGPFAEERGVAFVRKGVKSVDPEAHTVELDDGTELGYDYLVVAVGGSYHPALKGATTFPSPRTPLQIDELITRAAEEKRGIAFVVPTGITWALPIYEVALMAARRAGELGLHDVELTIVTPEDSPLAVFGPAASEAVASLLAGRGIGIVTGAHAHERDDGELVLTPGDRTIAPAEVIALPVMSGPAIPGLPSDDDGFIPIDEHARVIGADDVYAAGDGTNFPIKQGGLATQQADAAAADIAQRIGADVDPEPFRPVLRGKLLTGGESLHLKADVAGGGGESESSLDYLWWPPHKISARYLAPLLYHGGTLAEPAPPGETLDIEVALPREWHQEPMALDPHRSPRID